MVKKALKFFFLFFALGLITINGQSISLFGQTGQKKDIEEKEFKPTRLDSLGPKWFKFFETSDSKKYRKNSKTFKNYLRVVYKRLPQDSRVKVYADLENTVFGSNFYYELIHKKKRVVSPPRIFKKEYHLKDFLKVAETLWEKKSRIKESSLDISNLENTYEASVQNYDNFYADYLKTDANKPKKIELAFHVISKKIQNLIGLIQLNNQREDFKLLEKDTGDLENEFDLAQKKLFVSNVDRVWSNEEIRRLKKKYRTFLFEKRERNRIERKTESFVMTQKGVFEKVIEADLKMALLNRTLLKNIYLLKEGVTTTQLIQIKDDLDKWKTQSTKINEQKLIWDQVTKREFKKDPIKKTQENLEEREMRFRSLKETFVVLQNIDRELGIGAYIFKGNVKILNDVEGVLQTNWTIVSETISNYGSNIIKALDGSLFTISGTPVTIMGIIRVFFIIFLSMLISRGVRFSLKRLGETRTELNHSSLYILGRLSHYLVISIGLMVGLSSIGIDFSNVALVAGALTVGIGFGLQSIFNNFVSGLILLFERPLKVGDYVELESGVRGEVKEINVRSTRITTRDNIDILVPNSEFINGRVTNWTLYDNHRRVHIPFGVAYGSDKELVKKAALEASENVKFTVKESSRHPTEVWLTGFGDSAINFELVVWVNHKVSKKDRVDVDYLWEIETALRKYDIPIPFPQRDLHIKSLFGHHDTSHLKFFQEKL